MVSSSQQSPARANIWDTDPPVAFYELKQRYARIGRPAALQDALDHTGDALRLRTLVASGSSLTECCDALRLRVSEVAALLDD